MRNISLMRLYFNEIYFYIPDLQQLKTLAHCSTKRYQIKRKSDIKTLDIKADSNTEILLMEVPM